MILKMALKQILASKQRTVITILLTGFSAFILIFGQGFMLGTWDAIIKKSIELYPGYMKVINKEFEENPSFDNIIFDVTKTKADIAKVSGVLSATARFENYALFATDEQTIAGLLVGIEPENETKISKLKASLVDGKYLSSDDTNSLYIGIGLAKRLQLKVGDELAIISNGADFSFVADKVIVGGIFKTELFSFNNAAAFMNKKYFDTIMASENMATSIVMLPPDMDSVAQLSIDVTKYIQTNEKVTNYFTEMKELFDTMEIKQIFGLFQLGIMFTVIFFVIAIYSFLNVYARIREFGVLKAIGTSPWQVAKMLLAEAIILSSIGVTLGGLGGAYLVDHFEKNPLVAKDVYGDRIDMEKAVEEFDMVQITIMPTVFKLDYILIDIVLIFIVSLLSVFYPIIMINRKRPIDAMKYV